MYIYILRTFSALHFRPFIATLQLAIVIDHTDAFTFYIALALYGHCNLCAIKP